MTNKLLLAPMIMFIFMVTNAVVTLTDAHLIEEEVNIVKQDAIPVANLSTSILENSKSAQILVFKFLQQHSDSLIGELKALEESSTTTLKKLQNYPLDALQKEQMTILNKDNALYYDLVFNQVIPKSKESLYLIHDITDKQGKIIIKDLHKLQETLDSASALVAASAIEHTQNAEIKLALYVKELHEEDFQKAYQELKGLKDNINQLAQLELSPNEMKLMTEIEEAVKHFYADSKQLKAELIALDNILNQDLTQITHELAESSHKLQDESWKIALDNIDAAYSNAEALIISVELNTIIALLASIIAVVLIARKITAPLKHLTQCIQQVNDQGDFSISSGIQSKDEIGIIAKSFDKMLDTQSQAFMDIKRIMSQVSEGQFTGRIDSVLVGEFLSLKNCINDSAQQLESTFSELNRVNHCISQGDFDEHITADLKGEFKLAADSTNNTVDSLKAFVTETNAVMEQISQGNLKNRIEMALPGDLNTLKEYINSTVTTVESTINEIKEVVQAQATGDLSTSILGDYQGDFNTLKTAINTSANELNRIVSEIKVAANNVQRAVVEVGTASDDLSMRTQTQAANIEETAAALEEMTSSVSEHTDSTIHADEIIHKTKDQSVKGMKIVESTRQSMAQITTSSEEIAEIITLIDSIAFQTNLLALNAAVEAARAGEHGRGFAVVASEVRNLAQKSADAASNIKTIIETSVNQVKQGEKQVGESGKMLNAINSSIIEITTIVEEITNSSKEERTGIEQINIAISQIDQITQQNAAISEETSAAATQMQDEAEHMMKSLAFFKNTKSLQKI